MLKKYKKEIMTLTLILFANVILFLILAGVSENLIYKYVCEECTVKLAWGCDSNRCIVDDMVITKLIAPFIAIILYVVLTSKVISKAAYKNIYIAYVFILPLLLFELVKIDNLDSYTADIPSYLIIEKIIIFSPSVLFLMALVYFIKRGDKNDN